jgi:hypothetical protein
MNGYKNSAALNRGLICMFICRKSKEVFDPIRPSFVSSIFIPAAHPSVRFLSADGERGPDRPVVTTDAMFVRMAVGKCP